MGWIIFNREIVEDHISGGPRYQFRLEAVYGLSEATYHEMRQLYPIANPPTRDREAQRRIVEIIQTAMDESSDRVDLRFAPSERCLYELLFDKEEPVP
jgi:hypothetical protein